MARYIDADLRYIDADLLIKKIFPLGMIDDGNFPVNAKAVKVTIDKLPTADVQEVKHGKWKEHFAFGVWHYDCPLCDDGYATKEKDKILPNYCQNCGAKMDGRECE